MKKTCFTDICTLIMGQSPDSSSYNTNCEGLPFYQGNSDFGEWHPIPRVWCSEPKKIAQENDILISVRAPIGDLNIANEKCCIGRGLAAIRIINSDNVDLTYLYHFFESKKTYLQEKGTGSTFKAINKDSLINFVIPLPSIKEQKSISQELSALHLLIKGKKNQLFALDELVKSRFIEMFGHYFEDSRYFVKVGDIATATIGLTYKPDNVTDEGIIVLRSGNIQNAELCLSDDIVRVSNIKIKEDKLVRENDILMCSRNGSARLVGKCCLIPKLNEQMSYGAFMTVIRSKYPYFLNGFFNSTYFLQQLTGTQTASVNQITTGMLNGYTVIKPGDTEENEFAEFVKLIDKSKFIVQQQIKDLQELLDSKMDEYFR